MPSLTVQQPQAVPERFLQPVQPISEVPATHVPLAKPEPPPDFPPRRERHGQETAVIEPEKSHQTADPAETGEVSAVREPGVSVEQRQTQDEPGEDRTSNDATATASGNASSSSGGGSQTATSNSGGGNPAASADFSSQIAAILARHKRYPRRARSRRMEGTGALRFILDSTGDVRGARIASSTGHAIPDEELLALLERAAPLPPIPPQIGVAQMEFVVPIEFHLR